MKLINTLPKWAQGPLRLLSQSKLPEGVEKTPLDQAGRDQLEMSRQWMEAVAAVDEVPGQDQALGRPGLVESTGLTFRFEDDAQGRHQVMRFEGENGLVTAMFARIEGENTSVFAVGKAGETREVGGGVTGPGEEYFVSGKLLEDASVL